MKKHIDNRKSCSVHTLFELSITQWNRYSSNSISVGKKIQDITDKKHPIIHYETVSYGSNITMKRRKCKSHGRTLHWLAPMFKNL